MPYFYHDEIILRANEAYNVLINLAQPTEKRLRFSLFYINLMKKLYNTNKEGYIKIKPKDGVLILVNIATAATNAIAINNSKQFPSLKLVLQEEYFLAIKGIHKFETKFTQFLINSITANLNDIYIRQTSTFVGSQKPLTKRSNKIR